MNQFKSTKMSKIDTKNNKTNTTDPDGFSEQIILLIKKL